MTNTNSTTHLTFDEWLYKVCENISQKTMKKDVQDIFTSLDLTDAKLQFVDGVEPEEFEG